MLSAQLLAILRTYWRLARPEHWLFPGRDATRPIEPMTLHAACRSARAAAGIGKKVTVHTPTRARCGRLPPPQATSATLRPKPAAPLHSVGMSAAASTAAT